MSVEQLGNEIAGRIEAINWFMLDLADELVASGCIDRHRLLHRLRLRDELEDQLEYMRIAHSHLSRLTDVFAAEGPEGGQKPAP